jgi:hypothetical protein
MQCVVLLQAVELTAHLRTSSNLLTSSLLLLLLLGVVAAVC